MYCNPGPDFTFCFIYLYWRDLYQWDRFWEYCSGFAALVLCNKHPPNLNGSQQQTCIPLLLLSGSTMTLQCSAGHKQTLLLDPGQIYDFSMCLFSGWSNNSSLEHTLTGLVKIGPHFLSLNLAYSLFHPQSHWCFKSKRQEQTRSAERRFTEEKKVKRGKTKFMQECLLSGDCGREGKRTKPETGKGQDNRLSLRPKEDKALKQ